MTTAYTRHVILVVKPGVAAAVNTKLKDASFDPTGGDKTFTVALRAAGDATNTIAWYWAAGAATPAMLVGLRNRLLAAGATNAEVTLIPQGTTFTTTATQRMWCFDGDVWTPDDVLAFMSADRLASTPF